MLYFFFTWISFSLLFFFTNTIDEWVDIVKWKGMGSGVKREEGGREGGVRREEGRREGKGWTEGGLGAGGGKVYPSVLPSPIYVHSERRMSKNCKK